MSLTAEFSVEQCLAELDVERGKLPVAALRWAQQNREVMIPALIRLVEETTSAARAGDVPTTNGHFFAFILLAEFRARDAWPALVAAMRLPGELPFALFGDLAHDPWKCTVCALASDRIDEVLALIRDTEVNEYVRWSTASGLTQMVAWDLRSRDEVVGWLRTLLQETTAARDYTLGAAAVCELSELWPGEALDDILAAYDERQIDESIIDRVDVEAFHAEGLEARMRQLVERRIELTDTVLELSHWASFAEPKSKPFHSPAPIAFPKVSPAPIFDTRPEGTQSHDDVGGTIRRQTSRVGRNDPCPCASGKKFKKCCGLNS